MDTKESGDAKGHKATENADDKGAENEIQEDKAPDADKPKEDPNLQV